MNIRIISLVILFSFLYINMYANAEVIIDKEGNYVNVDKFVPSRGVKVKHSQLAEMMENSTRNAMNKNNNQEVEKHNIYEAKESEYQKYKRYTKNKQYTTVNGYRLF